MEKDRRLRCLLAPELYEDGRLSAAKAVHSATKLLHEDHDLGFKGTRIVSISETYLEISSPSDLLRYEKELGSSFNLPLSALCLYSASRIAERRLDEFLLRLFPAHGVIVGKSMAWDNG